MGVRAPIAVVLALGLALASCGGGQGDEGEVTTPSPPTSPTASPGASPAETPTAVSGPVTPATGEAHVEVTGDIARAFDVPLDEEFTSRFNPSTGRFSLAFDNKAMPELTLDRLTLAVRSDPMQVTIIAEGDVFQGFEDDCTLTVLRLDAGGVEGTFSCPMLSSAIETGAEVSASGTFSAAP